MQFKVGDRVEAIKPPNGVEDSEADQIGLGHLTAINPDGQFGETHAVRLDSGDEWYYSEDRLRHAIEKIEIHPTPSITVGTQVRLTGVVENVSADGYWVNVHLDGSENEKVYVNVTWNGLEVIRQPFKRGEVVYLETEATKDVPCRVLEDENAYSEGLILLVAESVGSKAEYVLATDYERRP